MTIKPKSLIAPRSERDERQESLIAPRSERDERQESLIALRSERRQRQDRGAISDYQQQITAVVEALGEGEVVSFGDVAARAGYRRAARAAGAVLAKSGDTLPWWRVVYADGHLPDCNPSLQAERLMEEGVRLRGFRVVKSSRGRFAQKDADDGERNRPARGSR